MKKLRKINLDELTKSMSTISEAEQRKYVGGSDSAGNGSEGDIVGSDGQPIYGATCPPVVITAYTFPSLPGHYTTIGAWKSSQQTPSYQTLENFSIGAAISYGAKLLLAAGAAWVVGGGTILYNHCVDENNNAALYMMGQLGSLPDDTPIYVSDGYARDVTYMYNSKTGEYITSAPYKGLNNIFIW